MTDQRHTRARTSVGRLGVATAIAVTGIAVGGGAGPVRAAQFVVDTTSAVLDADVANADGVTSLADAVYLANANGVADTITFDLPPEEVALIDTVNVPAVTEDLIVQGPGRTMLTLTSSTGTVLAAENGADFQLSGVTIDGTAGGAGPFDGIGLNDVGAVAVESVDVESVASGLVAAQPGPDPAGSLTVSDSTVTGAIGPGVSTTLVADVDLAGVTIGDSDDRGASLADASAVAVTDVSVSNAGLEALYITGAADTSVADTTLTENGAGLTLVDSGDATLERVTAADNDGDGVVVERHYGAVTVAAAEITGNGGGGVVVDGSGAVAPVGDTLLGDVTVTDSTISSNTAGGISITQAGDAGLSDLTIADNGNDTTASFGGLTFGPDDLASAATVERVAISGNQGDAGGGVSTTEHDGDLTIDRSTITANVGALGMAFAVQSTAGVGALIVTNSDITAHDGSAPVVLDDGLPVRIEASTVAGNVVPALFSAGGGSGISVRNSTVSANTAADAIFTNSDFSFIDVAEATVSGNVITSPTGGVFRRTALGGQVVANNAILTGNGAPLAAADHLAPAPATNHSVVPAATPAGGTGNVLTDDPGLGSLTDNGGPTRTMLPMEGSPAVDRGDPAGATTGVTTDQRGFARIAEGRIDIGAVERQRSPFVVSLPPARILETRAGPTERTIDRLFEGIGRRADGSELELDVAGRAGVPPDAKAVVVNVTAVRPSGVGFVTVHPCLVNPPLASSLNFRTDVDSGNEIVAELDDDGRICLFNRTDTDLVVDVVGYVPADSRYLTVGPARLLDTRDTGFTIDGLFQQTGIRGSDTELELDVAGRGGVSDAAVAVVINVTAVKPVNVGYVTVHPCLDEEPTAASLNFEPGVNRGNEIVAQLDADGQLCLYTFGSAQLVVDVVGQLSSENVYSPVEPARLVETRALPNRSIDGVQEGIGRLAATETLTVEAGDRAGVPAGASGVVVNVTAIRPDFRGFITVWDCTGDMPLAASLNYITGEIVGNELVVELNASGEFCLFTSRATDVAVDVVGYLD